MNHMSNKMLYKDGEPAAWEKLPEEFLQAMEELLGHEYPDYLKSFQRSAYSGLRVNTGKISVEDFLKRTEFSLRQIPWIGDGFYLEGDAKPGLHPDYAAGLFYLQEPSAMTPADRLPVEAGMKVLDLCAAPGGKATKLAVKLSGKGFLYANDISMTRAKALLKNLEKFGFDNICVTAERPAALAAAFPNFFDRILVDAPCSGEGMFRKDTSMVKAWKEKGPVYYAEIQRQILGEAWKMLAPGGMLLYSTCTFAKVENEDVIRDFLEKHSDSEMEDLKGFEGFARALGFSKGAVRIFPHKMEGEGHFLALLKKKGEPVREEAVKNKGSRNEETFAILPEDARAFLERWYSEHILRAYKWHMIGDQIYCWPRDMEIKAGLRYLRTGLHVGKMKGKRFEPSQALALAWKTKCKGSVADLRPDDYRLTRYLKGETLDLADLDLKEGWILIASGGFPLGWGKMSSGSVKNRYPAALRFQ